VNPVVLAHGLAGRADLPLPAELFGVGAAIVLAASFAGLAAGWTRPKLQEAREPRPRPPLALEIACGLIGVLVFAVVVYAGLAGTEQGRENLATMFVYVIFWVGIAFASLLFGDVFRLFNPWRAVGRAAGSVIHRFGGEDVTEPLRYPERLGRWPAVIGLAVFTAMELAWGDGKDPQTLAVLTVAYFVAMMVGQGLYGVETWSRRGDAFGVYFGFIATLSPFSRQRPPQIDHRVPGTVAVLVVAIGSTMFDGAREGPLFGDFAPWLQEAFTGAGLSKGSALELSFLIGLLIAFAVVALIYRLGVAGMHWFRGAPEHLGGRFVHTLIPIAAAYVVAHYFSLLVYDGQQTWAVASDPLGEGSDLFGSAGRSIDYGVVSSTAIWYVQVAALVIGHVAGLVLAHDRAIAIWDDARAAIRSQLAMLAVMVAFTCLGLWQLSVANA
jgi:hypothetical protein